MADQTSLRDRLKATAAGFNVADEVSVRESLPIGAPSALARERAIQSVEAEQKKLDAPAPSYTSDILQETLTGTLWSNLTAPGFNADPNFTDERYEARLKEAVEGGLPEDWLPELKGARSDEHFDYLLGRAMGHIERQQRLSEAGWGVWGANFLANFLDPASMVIGAGVVGPAFKLARAAQLGVAAQRGVQAGAGALAGGLVVGAEDAAGQQPHTSEYLMAIGLGGILGGAFGPLATNPATVKEAATLARMGREMHDVGETVLAQRFDAVPEVAPGLEGVPRQSFRPAGPAAIARAVEAAKKPAPVVREVDAERILEVQIEANRLHIEEAKAQLKTMKRGSPEAEEVRLAAVAAQKEMKLLEDQLKRFQDTGELPPSMRQPEARGVTFRTETNELGQTHATFLKNGEEIGSAFVRDLGDTIQITNLRVAPAHQRQGVASAFQAHIEQKMGKRAVPDSLLSEAEYRRWLKHNPDAVRDYEKMGDSYIPSLGRADDVDEIATLAPDDEMIRQNVESLRQNLRNVTDPDTADEIEAAIEGMLGMSRPEPNFVIANMTDEDVAGLVLQRQAAEMRLVGKKARGEDTTALEAQLKTLNNALGEPDRPLPRSAGAAANPDAPDTPEVLEFLHVRDDDWRALKPGQVVRGWANKVRISRSGRGSRTENEAAALTFHHLFNDAAGKRGHAKTPWSTDQHKDQLFATFKVPYYQARMAGFDAYSRAMGYNRISRVTRYDEFDQHVGLALRSGGDHLPENIPQEAAEAILNTAEGLRRAYSQILERMQEANLPGARETKPDPNFMPRFFNKRALIEINRDPSRGFSAIERVVRNAIRNRHDELGLEIDDRLLNRLARGYAKNITTRAYEVGDEWTIAISNGDRNRLAALLRDSDANIPEDEINEIMRHLWSLREKSKAMFGSLNQRVLLDEFAEDSVTGLRFYQLLDNNANRVFTSYANRAAGHIALAELKIRAPIVPRIRTVETVAADGTSTFQQVQDGFEGGHVIFDGIRTPADEQKLFSLIENWGADHLTRTGEDITKRTAADLRMLKFAFDRLKGIPDERQTTAYGHFLRDLRNYNFVRLMWQGGIAQVLETGTLVGTLGVRAAFSQLPGLRRMIDAAGNSRLMNPLMDDLETIGIGGLRHHGMAFHHLEQVGDDVAFNPTSPRLRDRVSNALAYATQVTNEFSGMGLVTQQLERWAAAATVQRMADIGAKLARGKKLSRSDTRRLAQLDIDEADMEAIARQLAAHATKEDRILFKGKIARLNFDKWDDPEAMAKFQHAIFRNARKIVQTGDLGNTALWMSQPTAQTFFQFRNFTFTAWENHTLYNLHMADIPALMSLIWGFGWAAAVRGAQVKAVAAMRPDGAEYEEKHLSPEALAKAAFQRTGPASLLPAIIDTIALFTGQEASFDARHTGQPTDIVGGSPSVSLAFSIKEGLGGAIDSLARRRPISQAEIRAIQSSLPMATFMPFMGAMGHLIQDLPKRAPEKKPLFGD